MNHDDLAFGAPEPLTTAEAAELANTLPATLEDAYAEGRADQLEDDKLVIADLLEALRAMVFRAARWHPTDPVLVKARAAIAKATNA